MSRKLNRQPAPVSVLLTALLAAGPGVHAQSEAGSARVVSVTFSGLETVSDAYVRSVVATLVGQPFDEAVAEEDVQRLFRTGRFLSVAFETQTTAEGLAVTFQLVERPLIKDVRIVGNVHFKDKKLLEQVPISVGDPVSSFSVAEGRNAIESFYRQEGYGEARVAYDENLLDETGELVYTVEEGVRVRVRTVLYEGNDSIPARELGKHVSTKTYLWIFRDGKFDADTVEGDAFAIQGFYRDRGFLDARASYRLEVGADPRDLTVVFTISEGTQYFVESIAFRGNTVFTDEQLREPMRLTVGDAIQRPLLERDAKAVWTLYGEHGYIYAEVIPERVFSETPGRVRVTLDITENDPIRVGRVVVRGNERTKDKVVRRAVELFPEQVFNLTKASEAQTRLVQTQIFSKATVSPVGTTPGVRDVLVNVEESARAGDLIFGVGVTSNSGLVGSFVIDIKNFDVFDWPRSFSEFIKLRSFHGAGQRLRLEAQPGTELNRFRIDFTEPYFLDKPLTFGLSAYLFTRQRDGYDEQRIGGNVSFGKRFEKGPLKNWFGEVSLRAENVDIDPDDIFTAHDIRKDKGNNFLTGVRTTLVRDRTDNRFLPTTGDRITLSYEQVGALGGDQTFGKVTGGYTRHQTVYTDVQDRKSVLSFNFDAGAIIGDAPVFERFYAGGIGSLRGFQFRSVSPRGGLIDPDEDPIGGDLLVLFGTEYSFPLYANALRGVLFTDMGSVGKDYSIETWRVSVGVGVRWVIELLGPVPLEFNLAFPVVRDDADEEQVFSFFIGAVF